MTSLSEVISKTVFDIQRIERLMANTGRPHRSVYRGKIYPPSPKPAQGRNERCNCGSFKKFKKCCGRDV